MLFFPEDAILYLNVTAVSDGIVQGNQDFQDLFPGKTAAVQTQVVSLHAAPFLICIVVVIVFSLFIHFFL